MEEIELLTLIGQEMEKLRVLSSGYIKSTTAAHEIEKGLFKGVLALGKTMLQYVLDKRISQYNDSVSESSELSTFRYKGIEKKHYLSLFGGLTLNRSSYWSKDFGKVHPSDSHLSLPTTSFWSYTIEELVGVNSAECDFKESVRLLNTLLELGLSGKSAERNATRLGSLVEPFYESTTETKTEVKTEAKIEVKTEVKTEPVYCSGSFDGKGVPKIKPKVAESVKNNPKKRLGKGEKKGIMEMATVSVTSTFTPKERSVESIIRSLMGSPLSPISKMETTDLKGVARPQDNRWHKDIHRRAFLANQQKAVDYGLDKIKENMVHPQSRFVVPIDAGIGLEDKVLDWVEKNNMSNHFEGIILDIIHVSEYVWNAATAIFGEKSTEKPIWVRQILSDLLNSQTKQVIKDLEQIVSSRELCQSKIAQIEKTIKYFTNHQHKMDYKTFIEKGYPVSSALVESACGHLVKERMEQTGMRWSSSGAQNILDMRAVKLNDHVNQFMTFRIKMEQDMAFKIAA